MPKPRTRNHPEFQNEFVRSLNRLSRQLKNYQNGDVDAWQDMATKLFILLCDRTPVPLAKRIMPNVSLHPLLVDISEIKHDYSLIDAVKKHFDANGITFDLFDLSKPKIGLEEWLQQSVLYVREETPNEVLDKIPWVSDGKGMMFKDIPEELLGESTDATLELIISEARNQMGGGHFTPSVRAIMQATESVIVKEKGIVTSFHAKCIVAIAEYITTELEQQWIILRKASGE